MLNDKQQLERLREIAAPVCSAHGLALVDARFASEHGGLVLRVLIERPETAEQAEGGSGVSLGDCQSVSRDLSTLLDVEGPDLLPGRYRLEVGSPGLDRCLRPKTFSASQVAKCAFGPAVLWTGGDRSKACCKGSPGIV